MQSRHASRGKILRSQYVVGSGPPPCSPADLEGRSLVPTYARIFAASVPEKFLAFPVARRNCWLPSRLRLRVFNTRPQEAPGMFLDLLFVVRPGDSKVTIKVRTSETLTLSPLP